jgi:O-antigen ligase
MKLLKNQEERSPWPSLLLFSLAGCVLFILVSISVMESFLALAFIFWLVVLIKNKERVAFPSFFWPLLVYSGLSLLACFFSVSPEVSLKDAKELALYIIIPISMTALSTPRGRSLATRALLASGLISALYSVGYLIFKAQPGERMRGFMGHYMTQAGLLLLFLCAALCFVLFSRDKARWLWGIAFLLAVLALTLTLTRSAWVGFVVALGFILLLYKPKSLILVPLLVGLFFLLSPEAIKRRALSIFNPRYYSNQLRIQYLKAGIKIIKDFPLLGTGPDTVDMVFQDPRYGLSDEAKKNVHLHDNFIQIAAERGIPTLLAWVTFIIWAFFSLIPLLKNRDPSVFPYGAAAGASILALVTAGLFEYNFADSEITVLFLYLITVPFASKAVKE